MRLATAATVRPLAAKAIVSSAAERDVRIVTHRQGVDTMTSTHFGHIAPPSMSQTELQLTRVAPGEPHGPLR